MPCPDEIRLSHQQESKLDSYFGLSCVACSAVILGVVAAMVKTVDFPAVMMLQFHSIMQWIISLILCMRRFQLEENARGTIPPEDLLEKGSSAWKRLMSVLFANETVRHWLLFRATLYYAFMLLWWNALARLPLGDAI